MQLPFFSLFPVQQKLTPTHKLLWRKLFKVQFWQVCLFSESSGRQGLQCLHTTWRTASRKSARVSCGTVGICSHTLDQLAARRLEQPPPGVVYRNTECSPL